MKIVEVEYPDSVYTALGLLATARGTTITDVIHGEGVLLARKVIKGQEVLELHTRGLEVRDIARKLDITNAEVRRHMDNLGLRSNRI